MLFLHALQVCTFSSIILTIDGYVFFSANIDDFKNLASKLVPKELAVQLTELVKESSIQNRQDRHGGHQRNIQLDRDKPYQTVENKYIDVHVNYGQKDIPPAQFREISQKKTETKTIESFFEPDRMLDKDYERLEDTTFPTFVSKRYKTVQRMATTKDWFEEPPSFVNTVLPTVEKLETPSHSIYYKDPDTNVKPNSPERDINENYAPFKETNNAYDDRSNGKQMMQYFPVENKIQVKKVTNLTDAVRVNGRDIRKGRPRKMKKIKTKEAAIFDTVIMDNKKDSYEEYVIPKKDDDYFSDEIGPNSKKRPTPSSPKGLRGGTPSTTKGWTFNREVEETTEKTTRSWPLLSDVGYGMSSTNKKQPIWSVESVIADVTLSATTKQPFWSAEITMRDKIPPVIRERPAWDQRDHQNKAQRQRTTRSTITTEDTFLGYMGTERERKTSERQSPAERKTTPEREKTTEEYVLDDEFDNKQGKLYTEGKDPIKARTESLLFDSKEANENQTIETKYTMKGTGIPTREYYKMSSPDYYKKLPRIVEKYDFDEPIPEADREREKIDDRLAQEPARVNKKVRQQQEGTERREPLERKQEITRIESWEPREKKQEVTRIESRDSQDRQQEKGMQRREPRDRKLEKRVQRREPQDRKQGKVNEHYVKAGPLETILENIGFRFMG